MEIMMEVKYTKPDGEEGLLRGEALSFESAEEKLGKMERFVKNEIAAAESVIPEGDEKQHGEPASFCTNQDGNCEPDERCNCKA